MPEWTVYFWDEMETRLIGEFHGVPVPRVGELVHWQGPPGHSQEGMHWGRVCSVDWFFQLGVDWQDYRAEVRLAEVRAL